MGQVLEFWWRILGRTVAADYHRIASFEGAIGVGALVVAFFLPEISVYIKNFVEQHAIHYRRWVLLALAVLFLWSLLVETYRASQDELQLERRAAGDAVQGKIEVLEERSKQIYLLEQQVTDLKQDKEAAQRQSSFQVQRLKELEEQRGRFETSVTDLTSRVRSTKWIAQDFDVSDVKTQDGKPFEGYGVEILAVPGRTYSPAVLRVECDCENLIHLQHKFYFHGSAMGQPVMIDGIRSESPNSIRLGISSPPLGERSAVWWVLLSKTPIKNLKVTLSEY